MISYPIVIAMALFFLTLVYLGIRVVESVEAENDMLAREIEASRMYQESLSSRVEQVRRYRHDADSLLRAIEHASRQADDDADMEAGAFAASAECTPELPDARYPLTSAAFDLHARQCAEAGIPFACQVADGAAEAIVARGVEDSDLCIILQNLLDNAYEANCRISPDVDERFGHMMALEVRAVRGKLRLRVRNRTATSVTPSFRTQKAQRSLHGVGMMVVDDIVKKYGGSVDTSFDPASRVFSVDVIL